MPSQPDASQGSWRLTILAALAAALVTAAVIGLPFLRFAYRAPELHVALETTAALTALVLAFLVYGRFRATGSLQALLLALSLGIVAVANLLLAMLPAALGIAGQEVRDWASVALRLLGTLLLTTAAVLRPEVVVSRRRAATAGLSVLMLLGGAREVQSFWQARAHAAVLEERRRLARDLHDGLTQELSYIWTQSRRLAAHPDDRQAVERIGGAAARALDEARGAIAALTQNSDAGFAAVLEQAADGLASRYDASVAVDVAPDVQVSPEQGDALLRIVAEAFRNAVRHGGASTVYVAVRMPLELVVRDEGSGFDPALTRDAAGFGLTSMRERAEGLGASFALESAPGAGATVTVRWPESGSNGTRHPRE